jgi:membrane-bound lytic murein transglycosylase A
MPLGAQTDAAKLEISFEPVSFGDLPGWAEDDHLAAFRAFLISAGPIERRAEAQTDKTAAAAAPLIAIARKGKASASAVTTGAAAREFFEAHFAPHRVVHAGPEGLLTGYYEPIVAGSRTESPRYRIPVYRRPPDLVNLVAEQERGALGDGLTHARRTATGVEPYATRAEIEGGALAGQGLELVWLADPVDTFFMHIQGSGRIRFDDGTMVRVTYDGKNGHRYTSIGRYLIDSGLFPADRMSLDALKEWLSADAERGRAVMQQNKSFVFFRELSPAEGDNALGVLSAPLSDGRSLAVDTNFHALGTPVYVVAPELTPWNGASFQRLMVAQDVGSAIRGPERGDIYFGSGDEAGRLAGTTKHAGRFFVLLAKPGGAS